MRRKPYIFPTYQVPQSSATIQLEVQNLQLVCIMKSLKFCNSIEASYTIFNKNILSSNSHNIPNYCCIKKKGKIDKCYKNIRGESVTKYTSTSIWCLFGVQCFFFSFLLAKGKDIYFLYNIKIYKQQGYSIWAGCFKRSHPLQGCGN